MEYRTLKLVLNLVKVVVVLLAASLTLMIFSGTNLAGPEMSEITAPNDDDAFKTLITEEVGFALQIAYWVGGLCAAAAILFAIYQVILNFKRSIPALAGVIIFAIIIYISYLNASGTMPPGIKENMDISASQFQLFGGAVISIYVFLGLAILAIIVSEVRRLIIGSKS